MRVDALEKAVRRLSKAHGPQHWWPAESPFEMATGAILVQHASWRNAELALSNLRAATALNAQSIACSSVPYLESLIRPSGTFRVKARRLLALANWWCREFHHAPTMSTPDLRRSLLSIEGVGPETADCILLYAFSRPLFIADAYARRWMHRMGLIGADTNYAQAQGYGHHHLPESVSLMQEAHALVVVHSQRHCVARKPSCGVCTLKRTCAQAGLAA